MSVLIVGGGWSGLAAAVELTRHGVPVTLLEASRQLGGRARAVRFGDSRIDNGQHILLGAYQSVLDLLTKLGIEESSVLRRRPLNLAYLDEHQHLQLAAPRIPAPLHLAWALLTMKGMSLPRRLSAMRTAVRMRVSGFDVTPDLPLSEYLHNTGNDPVVARQLWHPLCLAALNTPPEQASTRIFMRVLRDAFFSRRHASDMLLPITDLGTCIPEPARDHIESNGGSVQLGKRVLGIHLNEGRVRGVRLEHAALYADDVILATPPEATAGILGTDTVFAPLRDQLSHLHSLPICTLYLRYPEAVSLPQDFIGLLGTATQWLFDRGRLTGERGLIAAVISGPGAHMRASAEALTAQVLEEIGRHFPAWPQPLATKLIRERRATFAACTGVDEHRPGAATGLDGLWLAGDYTDTGYPATLEGAVRSGLECARLIIQNKSSKRELNHA